MNEEPLPEAPPEPLAASLRRMTASVAGLIQTRVDLFSVELQQEKLRATKSLAWLALAGALLFAGVLVAIGTLALFLWNRFGYAGLVGLAGGTIVAGVALFFTVRARINRSPAPFSATIGEFQKDSQWLQRPE